MRNGVLALLLLEVAFLGLSGCSLILSGRSQTVTVETNPPGARCKLERDNRVVGQIEQTPGAVHVQKTKDDIRLTCSKQGYQESTAFLESGTEGATFGNIVAGGLVGWAVDSATGADNKYQEVITVTLLPLEKEVL